MYLREFKIRNLKCFKDVTLEFVHEGDDFSGWNVLLGGNGVGKSTLLQAMAIAMAGPVMGQRLLTNPDTWIRTGRAYGEFEASIVKGKDDSQTGQPRKKPYSTQFYVTGKEEITLEDYSYDQPQLIHRRRDEKDLFGGPYAAKKPGWFSCGYGPFRRLLGGSAEESKYLHSPGRESRFITLFREAAALTNCTEWLITLFSRSIDSKSSEHEKSRRAIGRVMMIINGLLPGDIRIDEISTDGVIFRTIGGAKVTIHELSDGYRSFLALVIDILRHLVESTSDVTDLFSSDGPIAAIESEGVIFIDEIDAHLHPFWQREIGFRLKRVFPYMQFIVSSHSPFIAQAATDGGLFVLNSSSKGDVEVTQPIDSVRGWRADQILTSPLFELNGTRDEETELLIRRHADLVAKSSRGKLTKSEQEDMSDLGGKLSERLTAPGETIEDRESQDRMQSYIESTLAKIGATP